MSSDEVKLRETLCQEENNIAPEIIKEIIEKALDSIFDVSRYEFALKYDPSLNPEEPFMKRKLTQIRNEILNSFGSSSLELKKSYSKLEQEKIELKNKIILQENSKEDQLKNGKTNQQNPMINNFMSDAKIHKTKLEKEKEYALQVQKMIGNKRKSDGEFQNMRYLDNKTTQCENSDWSSLMANSIKKKSRLEIEKEKFLEEAKIRKEQQLKNITTLSKSQVFKFDENISDKKISENIQSEDNKLQPITSNATERICQVCKILIEPKANSKRISNKCEHFIHYVIIKFKIFRNVGSVLKLRKKVYAKNARKKMWISIEKNLFIYLI
jgi:hypothetical protein